MRCANHYRCAFTLVELLVTIAVLAVLIGILVPSLAGARDAGRTTVCLTKMRTLGTLTAQFASDHRDEMPRSRHSAGFTLDSWGFVFHESLTGEPFESRDQAWFNTLNSHFRCPNDDRHNEQGGYLDYFSYGYNVYFELRPDEISSAEGPSWRQSMFVPRPSDTVLFGELREESVADHAMAHFWKRYGAPPEIEAHRHGNRTNVVYLDTHAQSRAFDDTYDPARRIDRWNPGGWDGDDR